ncbi:cytochrome c biogenesis [Striga asiatica]|uniref:Cytochrome c biogenesis n=1 Tax=Striga asiatica TaxID=4170 RepID=A0A5A7QYN7_STRAF|nr:cytochrome c biogenesis [Striga asiatica]
MDRVDSAAIALVIPFRGLLSFLMEPFFSLIEEVTSKGSASKSRRQRDYERVSREGALRNGRSFEISSSVRPRLYHFHESLSMRYTFASTSTLCLVPLTVLGLLEPKLGLDFETSSMTSPSFVGEREGNHSFSKGARSDHSLLRTRAINKAGNNKDALTKNKVSSASVFAAYPTGWVDPNIRMGRVTSGNEHQEGKSDGTERPIRIPPLFPFPSAPFPRNEKEDADRRKAKLTLPRLDESPRTSGTAASLPFTKSRHEIRNPVFHHGKKSDKCREGDEGGRRSEATSSEKKSLEITRIDEVEESEHWAHSRHLSCERLHLTSVLCPFGFSLLSLLEFPLSCFRSCESICCVHTGHAVDLRRSTHVKAVFHISEEHDSDETPDGTEKTHYLELSGSFLSFYSGVALPKAGQQALFSEEKQVSISHMVNRLTYSTETSTAPRERKKSRSPICFLGKVSKPISWKVLPSFAWAKKEEQEQQVVLSRSPALSKNLVEKASVKVGLAQDKAKAEGKDWPLEWTRKTSRFLTQRELPPSSGPGFFRLDLLTEGMTTRAQPAVFMLLEVPLSCPQLDSSYSFAQQWLDYIDLLYPIKGKAQSLIGIVEVRENSSFTARSASLFRSCRWEGSITLTFDPASYAIEEKSGVKNESITSNLKYQAGADVATRKSLGLLDDGNNLNDILSFDLLPSAIPSFLDDLTAYRLYIDSDADCLILTGLKLVIKRLAIFTELSKPKLLRAELTRSPLLQDGQEFHRLLRLPNLTDRHADVRQRANKSARSQQKVTYDLIPPLIPRFRSSPSSRNLANQLGQLLKYWGLGPSSFSTPAGSALSLLFDPLPAPLPSCPLLRLFSGNFSFIQDHGSLKFLFFSMGFVKLAWQLSGSPTAEPQGGIPTRAAEQCLTYGTKEPNHLKPRHVPPIVQPRFRSPKKDPMTGSELPNLPASTNGGTNTSVPRTKLITPGILHQLDPVQCNPFVSRGPAQHQLLLAIKVQKALLPLLLVER